MTIRNEAQIASDIRQAITDLVVPLQTARTINVAAFERLNGLGEELMRFYKGSDRISKSLLNELHTTRRIIDNEMPHHKDRQQLERMSARLSMLFDLLLLNEVPEDRVPGVPRIR